jgi:hypothetical protein
MKYGTVVRKRSPYQMAMPKWHEHESKKNLDSSDANLSAYGRYDLYRITMN